MRNRQEPTAAEIERSQALIGAVLGVDETGELPPDHRIGANRPPEPISDDPPAEDKRVADLIEGATAWATQVPTIQNDELAAICADFIDQLDAQYEAFDERRKTEREAHNKALKEIQNKWLPRLERIDICRRALKPLHRAWLQLKSAMLKAEREEKEREAAEAQRRADQLAEQAEAGGPGTVTNMIGAAEAAQEAEKARQAAAAVPQRAQVRGTLGGRTRSLRLVWHAEVVKQDLLYEKFKRHPDMIALLHRLANAAVRAQGGPRPANGAKAGQHPALPGCYIHCEEV